MDTYNFRLLEKIRSKTVPSGDCILWVGGKDKDGYGRVRAFGKNTGVHRLVWFMEHGEIPHGMVVCHKCDTPSCVNVEHLFIGTQKTNIRDASEKGRLAHGTRSKWCVYADEVIKDVAENLVRPSHAFEKYGMSKSHFYRIKANECRKKEIEIVKRHESGNKYSIDCVSEILACNDYKSMISKYGISKTHYYEIRRGSRRKGCNTTSGRNWE